MYDLVLVWLGTVSFGMALTCKVCYGQYLVCSEGRVPAAGLVWRHARVSGKLVEVRRVIAALEIERKRQYNKSEAGMFSYLKRIFDPIYRPPQLEAGAGPSSGPVALPSRNPEVTKNIELMTLPLSLLPLLTWNHLCFLISTIPSFW